MYVGPCKAIQKERAKRQRMLKQGDLGSEISYHFLTHSLSLFYCRQFY